MIAMGARLRGGAALSNMGGADAGRCRAGSEAVTAGRAFAMPGFVDCLPRSELAQLARSLLLFTAE